MPWLLVLFLVSAAGMKFTTGWENSARLFANASVNLARRVENRPGQVEFCIGYIRDYPVGASAKKILVSQPVLYKSAIFLAFFVGKSQNFFFSVSFYDVCEHNIFLKMWKWYAFEGTVFQAE